MNSSKYKTDIRNLQISDEITIDILDHIDNIKNESDRSAVLIIGGVIERFLSIKISKILLKNAGARSMYKLPLDNKIQLSYALGLLTDNDYKELLSFKELRNRMAHSWEIIDLNNKNIKKLLSKLGNYGLNKPFENCIPRNYFNTWVIAFVFSLVTQSDDEVLKINQVKKNLASRLLANKGSRQ